jgi:hypothetical protein
MGIDADRIADAHRASILDIARRCGARLRKVGAHEFAGPCPAGCARQDGFVANERKNCFYCRPSGAKGDPIAMVQHALGRSFAGAIDFIVDGPSNEPKPAPAPLRPKATEADHNAQHLASAAGIVRELRPICGSPAERYLRVVRRIDVDAIADVLKKSDPIGWHPEVYFNQPGHALHGRRLGCIVGIMTDAETAKRTGAISRTFIDPNLVKVSKAKILGSPAGIVRLSADENVLAGLFLAEGLETCLAAMSIGCRPMWSTGSTALMKTFPVLSGIRALTIIADNDANGAGLIAAQELERQWRAAGKEVRILIRDRTGDVNDAIIAKAAS